MYHIIYDAGNRMLIFGVFGASLEDMADIKLSQLKEKSVGTQSDFRMTLSREQWSCGENFIPDSIR